MSEMRPWSWLVSAGAALALVACSDPVAEHAETTAEASHSVTVTCGYFVSPGASGTGTGSLSQPFTLAQALTVSSVPSNSTICLRGGTYGAGGNTTFQSSVQNVVVASFPGEHAVLNGGLHITGSGFTLTEVEITNSQSGARPPAVDIEAANVTLLGNLIHEGGDAGVYLRNAASGVTMAGNLIYANGFGLSGRGVRGKASSLTMRGNVIVNNEGQAIDLGSGDGASLQGNAIFGPLRSYGAGLAVTASTNLVDGDAQFGYPTKTTGALVATDNLFSADGSHYLWVGNLTGQTLTGNRIVDTGGQVVAYTQNLTTPGVDVWSGNAYEYTGTSSSPFGWDGMGFYSFQSWKSVIGRDTSSTFGTTIGPVWTHIESIEPGRALVSVAAFHGETGVDVPASGLGLGAEYEIWNAKNPCGDRPILGKTPTGNIHIPLTGWTEATPVAGAAMSSAQHAFLITSGRTGDLCGACTYYAAPGVAAGSGAGTKAAPWNLQDVLGGASIGIQPGKAVCLMEGEYAPAAGGLRYEVTRSGSAGAPIVIQPYPGHHVGLKASLGLHGSHLVLRDLEIYYTAFERVTTAIASPGFDIQRAVGGPAVTDVRIVNCRIHDSGGGFYTQTATTDSHLYGNVVYNNGWDSPLANDRGHGHGFYLQSHDGLQFAENNLVFNNFGAGMDMYGKGDLSGYRTIGNSVYEAGPALKLLAEPKDSVYFTVDDALVQGNLGYGGTYEFGSNKDTDRTDYVHLQLLDNKFMHMSDGLKLRGWRHPSVQGNAFDVVVARPNVDPVVYWKWNVPEQTATPGDVFSSVHDASAWLHNVWTATTSTTFGKVEGVGTFSWDQWRTAPSLGFDAATSPNQSTLAFGALTGQEIYYRPSSYQPLSGSVTVFNHDGVSHLSFALDLAQFGFTPGRSYVIRNAFDPCNAGRKNIVSGVYTGASVTVSLDPGDYSLALPLCYDLATGPNADEIQPLPLPMFGMFLVAQDEPGYCPVSEPVCTL
jgi:hypothetical protein